MPAEPLYNDRELLAKIAEGDPLAFKKIYEAYFSRTYNFAFHVLHAKELAQEVVQEAMLKIWQMGFELLEVKDLEGFLKTLAKRKAIDLLRKLELERRTTKIWQDKWQELHVETEEAILLSETRKILDRGIQELPPQQKKVYELCHQQGMKYDEVAVKLNIAPGTVHRHMKLALKFLRVYLKKHNDLAVLLILFKLI